jgi:hypothetical protein
MGIGVGEKSLVRELRNPVRIIAVRAQSKLNESNPVRLLLVAFR